LWHETDRLTHPAMTRPTSAVHLSCANEGRPEQDSNLRPTA
jgi:hypothetical protein